MATQYNDALDYHSRPTTGKIEIVSSKPCETQRDLSFAYTPGVAVPCLRIAADPEEAYRYTTKSNLVAVITNGTAVLGLGNIGALAGKPVMEGKAVLFKRFADVNAIDLEVSTEDPEEFIRTVRLLEASFGGINLEDIRAPDCFEIERRLSDDCSIPVFHDDQHGTAIISGAALINALDLCGKQIEGIRIVFLGAGAAAIATARFYRLLGARQENIVVCDRAGVIHADRGDDLHPAKREFALKTDIRTPEEACADADVVVGLSAPGAITASMLERMANRPIVFALANPDPEITYDEARATRPDAIIATGRSDFPNQVNNVLGFPFIFRGALDVRARSINEAMKVAAAQALARLAREDVPDSVISAYGVPSLRFGPDYLIPKPFDPRALLWIAPAIASAAMESGVARIQLDLDRYREELEARMGKGREMMRVVMNKARRAPRRVLLVNGEHEKMIRAAHQLRDEGLALPILLADPAAVAAKAREIQINCEGITVVDPAEPDLRRRCAERLLERRWRKGITRTEADELLAIPSYMGAAMLDLGEADTLVTGLRSNYADALRPMLQIIRALPDCSIAAGVFLIATRRDVLFFADASVNIDPEPDTLANIAIRTATLAQDFDVEPRIAMISFSDFGSVRHPRSEKVRQAVDLVRTRRPDLTIDGEMSASTALSEPALSNRYPNNQLRHRANVLIFPSLEAGTVASHIVQRLGDATLIGPILVGMRKAVHVLMRGAEVQDIVNLAAIGVVQALQREEGGRSAVNR
ncbi:MAG: NADP-dependent malic enzyme [Chthonomonadales bacterium]|nr:NADP-dependent malic enzyme [Chthonomonadales bacterium]